MTRSITPREEIVSGWRRSVMSGVAHDASPQPSDNQHRVFTGSLHKASDAAFRAIADDLAGLDLTLLLADRSGQLVGSAGDSASRTSAQVKQRGLVAGTDLSEEKVGVNGVGTAIEVGKGIFVDGSEHFIEAFRAFSCFGMPIFHPGTRRLEGVLNVTAPTESTSSLLEGFGRVLVRQIESQLGENTYQNEHRLMEEFIRMSRQCPDAVCALGDGTTLSNHRAEEILEFVDLSALRDVVDAHSETGASQATVEIDDGRSLTLSILRTGPRQSVVTMRPQWRERSKVSRGRPRSDHSGFVWGSRVPQSPQPGEIVAVIGETGSGRTSTAAQTVRGMPADHIEAISLMSEPPARWHSLFSDVKSRKASALIIDDVDILPATSLTILRQFLKYPHQQSLVLTSSPVTDEHSPLASVLALADQTVNLPPLRERLGELPAFVEGISKQVRGDRRARFSPGALNALARASWPGNLSQLKKVLTHTLAEHSGALVRISDLPKNFQADGRNTLTALERAEIAAIQEALVSAGGNKHQASKILGISRTTLYRRLRHFRIEAP